MHIREHVASICFPQEGEHRDDNQEGFESFTEQDCEGAEEARPHRRFAGSERGFCVGKQRVERADLTPHFVERQTPGDAGAQYAHRAFDPNHECAIACRQDRFGELETIEIGRERKVSRAFAVAFDVSGQRLASSECGRA